MLKRVADAAVLVFDDDAAGHKATVRTAALLLAAEMPVRVVSLPGGDDPDSFLRTKGAAEFQKLLDNAESVVSFQCRIEKGKERDAKSIDAIARISKAVLATVAACPGAVLRASMVDEAARLLGLPAAALAEELERMKTQPAPVQAAAPAEEEDCGPLPAPQESEAPVRGTDAGEAAPPPAREMAFMEFLFANERDKNIDSMVGEFLPDMVFRHGFTRRFVAAWRQGTVSENDVIAEFADGLPQCERGWFDELMLAAGRANAGERTATDIMQEFVRVLWKEFLARRRGELPAVGDDAAVMERLCISDAIKRLDLARWHDVKDIVRRLIMKG